MISLDGEVILANLCVSVPERDFIYYDHFNVYLSMILFDESEKLCWKHEIFLFQKWKKGRYSMSASQYKPGENAEIYVHIVA